MKGPKKELILSKVLGESRSGLCWKVKIEGGHEFYIAKSISEFGIDDSGRKVLRIPQWKFKGLMFIKGK